MRRRALKTCLPILAIATVVVTPGNAQDSHYWSHHYGGRAILLTGAVVGGIADASAAYYNPAGLSFSLEDEIFLGTQVYDLTNIRIETETGTQTTLDSDDLGRAPSFLGGMVPLGLGKHRFAYAIFKRHSFQMRVDGADLVTAGEVNGSPTAYARITFDANLSERWFGGSWAYPLSKTLGVGISTFIARRNQILEIDRTAQGFAPPNTVLTASQTDYYKLQHFRLLWKIGAELDLEQISFGLTVTTPGVRLYGKGERIIDEAESLGGVDGQGDYLAADFQEDVPAYYKSPISAALGLSMFFNKQRALHTTVEVFEKVDEYEVLDLQPAFSQSTGLPIDNDLSTSSEGVVNVAVGYEEYFSTRFTGFVSVSTDYSTAAEEQFTNLAVTRWDLYHLTGGATFGLGNALLTMGLGYSFGSENSTRIAAPQDDGLAEILGDPVPSEIEFQRFKIILGFSLST